MYELMSTGVMDAFGAFTVDLAVEVLRQRAARAAPDPALDDEADGTRRSGQVPTESNGTRTKASFLPGRLSSDTPRENTSGR